MPKFCKKSLEKLQDADPELIRLFTEVIKNYDHSILCAFRNETDQNEAFNRGATKLRFPNSKHNKKPSDAIDAAPYPLDWKDTKRFYHFAGYVKAVADQLGIKIRWGGDWDNDLDFKDNTFNDLPHFELIR